MPRGRARHSLWDEIRCSNQTSYCNCIERRVFLHYISLCCIYINMTPEDIRTLLKRRTNPKHWRHQERILYAELSKLDNFYCDCIEWSHPIKLLGLKRHNDQYFIDMTNDIMRVAQDRNIEFSAYYHPFGVLWKEACNEWEGRNHLMFHCDQVRYSDEFLDFVRSHPEMKVIVFSCQYLPDSSQGLENLRIIHWGSDYLLQKEEYQNINMIEKSFAASYHWISLNHNLKLARWMAALYLKGLGLDTSGWLSINIPTDDWRTHCRQCWSLLPDDDSRYGSIFEIGTERGKEHTINPPSQIYTTTNGNAENLDLRLRLMYANSAVEIVNESTFDFKFGIHMTEKFINSVYGMNLPIILGQLGIVEYCRNLGFDMFDDVVDNSYDVISRPIERLTAAIDRNRKLLEVRDFAIAAWHRCQPRLQANYELARYRLHDQVYNRVMSEVPAALDFLS